MVTLIRNENTAVTIGFPQKVTIDRLVEEFYKVKLDISLLGYHSANKAKALSGKKHEIMWELKKELEYASKRKGDKIKKRLWDELGVVI